MNILYLLWMLLSCYLPLLGFSNFSLEILFYAFFVFKDFNSVFIVRIAIRFRLEWLLSLRVSLFGFSFIFLYFFRFHILAFLSFWNVYLSISRDYPIFLNFSDNFTKFFLVLSLKENFHFKSYYFEKKTFSFEDLFFILQFLFFVADYYFLPIMIFKLFYKLSSKAHHIYSESIPIHYFIYSCSFFFQKQKLWSHLTLRYCLLTLPTGFPGQDSLCSLPTQSTLIF